MTTIYKINDKSSDSQNVLCFSFSEKIHKQINDWQVVLDKMVFDEQMKTGSFHGRFPIDDTRQLRMQKMHEKGIIRPYYGATSAHACTYSLQVTLPTCIVGVEHEVANERLSFEDTVKIIQTDASVINRNQKKGFMVTEKEYRTLRKWKNWNTKEEFTSRYIYKFSPSSIGLAITVTDTQTKEQLDISDYRDW